MKPCINGSTFKKGLCVIILFITAACFIPVENSFAADSPYLCNGTGCTVSPDPAAATKKPAELLSFAHTTDIHIVDEGNPIRAEELTVKNANNPYIFADLFKNISAANRPIGPYSAILWEYEIEDINNADAVKPLDFMIAMGDFTDSSIIPEFQLFVEMIDGVTPTRFKEHCDCRGVAGCECDDEPATVIPLDHKGLDTDFYAAIGNHDVEYMGIFTTDGFIGLLVKGLAQGIDIDELCYLEDLIGIFQKSEKSSNFADMMEEESSLTGKVKGAYAFNPKPFIRCIVLNTCEYTYDLNGKATPLENFSLGTLSIEQMAWLLKDIDANKDRICIIFAHHGSRAFSPFIKNNSKYYVTGAELREALKLKKNVVAYVDGHTHMNKIMAEYNTDGTGYWDITTSSIIDYPYEWRRITVKDLGTGMGMIKCEMKRPADLEKNVPMIDTEGDALHYGADGDRDIELYFKMPLTVAQAIIAEKPKPDEPPVVDPNDDNNAQTADSSDSGSSSMCFMTSALI
jgi:3',5'-cyclic AMP phosphodiesterase CpdA